MCGIAAGGVWRGVHADRRRSRVRARRARLWFSPPSELIAASIYDKYSVGLSFQAICTRWCFAMTNMIQVCSDFYRTRIFVADDCWVEGGVAPQGTP